MNKGSGIRAALATAALAALLGLTGCIPTAATGNWQTFGSISAESTVKPVQTMIFSDSIGYQALSGQSEIDRLALATGHGALVNAVEGASFSHFVNNSLLPNGEWAVARTLDRVRPRVTVFELGTNDARILAAEIPTGSGYTQADFTGSLQSASDKARSISACTVLVNATTRPQTAAGYRYYAQYVNNSLQTTVNAHLGFFRLADWDGYSRNHPEWFLTAAQDPTQFHQNADGQAVYRSWLYGQIQAAYNSC